MRYLAVLVPGDGIDAAEALHTIRCVATQPLEDGQALADAKAAEMDALSWEQLDAYEPRVETVTLPNGKVFRVKSMAYWDHVEWESDLHISVKVYAERGWKRFWPYKARGFRGGETLPVPTRPLTTSERALLDHLLAPEFDGVAALRQQAAHAEVVLQDEFPWFIELFVPSDAPPATNVHKNPVTGTATADPNRFGADITLWLDGDRLARIEVMWLDKEWPDLPSPDELHPASLR